MRRKLRGLIVLTAFVAVCSMIGCSAGRDFADHISDQIDHGFSLDPTVVRAWWVIPGVTAAMDMYPKDCVPDAEFWAVMPGAATGAPERIKFASQPDHSFGNVKGRAFWTLGDPNWSNWNEVHVLSGDLDWYSRFLLQRGQRTDAEIWKLPLDKPSGIHIARLEPPASSTARCLGFLSLGPADRWLLLPENRDELIKRILAHNGPKPRHPTEDPPVGS